MGITYSMVKQRPRSSPTKTRIVYLSGSFRKVGVKCRPPWKLVGAATLNHGDPATSPNLRPLVWRAGTVASPAWQCRGAWRSVKPWLRHGGHLCQSDASLSLEAAGEGVVTVTFPVGGPRSWETEVLLKWILHARLPSGVGPGGCRDTARVREDGLGEPPPSSGPLLPTWGGGSWAGSP